MIANTITAPSSILIFHHTHQFIKAGSLCACLFHGSLCGNLSGFPRGINNYCDFSYKEGREVNQEDFVYFNLS